MATALVSAVSGRKVRRDVAMTGELTLTGRVLPIGGVKEKVLGAVRAGIREIILPIDNEADLEDISEDVQETLTFHPAETLDDVIAVALVDGSKVAREPKRKRAGATDAGSEDAAANARPADGKPTRRPPRTKAAKG
jgi:ATP-dependent Lon protease